MPTSSLTGKSKDDLATIAAVSGLLTREQAMAMTKPQLMKFLKNAETAAKTEPPIAPEATTETTPEPAGKAAKRASAKGTGAPRKAPVRKKAAVQETATEATETAEPAPAEQVVVQETLTPIVKEPVQETPASVDEDLAQEATTAAVDAGDQAASSQISGKNRKPRRKPILEEGPEAKRPAPGKGKTPDRYQAKNQSPARSQDRNQRRPVGKGKTRVESEPENKRPMRVKVFGIPANPMAGQDHELEAAPTILPEDTFVPSQPTVEPLQQALEPAQPVVEPGVAAESVQERGLAEKELVSAPSGDKFNRKQQIESGESITGVLEIMPDGYGFLRRDNYLQGAKDAYVPPQYIRRFNLRPGDLITGPCKKQRDNDRYQALLYIKEVNGQTPDKMIRRPHFDRLTPIYPDERYVLETARNELSTRIIDLVAPIGKGQRGMIVSPPKAGKTILLQKIANAISTNNPDVKLIVLLIDERPEEVTDMQRSINGEVVFSTFDKTPENHVKVTELVLERAMRLVELKQDVVILLDSMTRLARAYNLTITPTGRTLSGGLDPGALYGPKRFFGAARNIENGGSLTIIATSLIETGSRMDEVIFEEFKGTGNMEVYLDRKLSEKRIFPAIDINRSGTRREELLLTDKELDAVWTIRKAFGQLDTAAVTETIINLLLKTQTNQQFISSINVSFSDKNVFDAMRGTRPSQANGNAQSSGGPGNVRRNYERDND